jgi:hypothetical protein
VPGLREHCTNTMIVVSNGWETLEDGAAEMYRGTPYTAGVQDGLRPFQAILERAAMCMMMCIIWRYEDGGLSFQIQLRLTEPPAGAPFAK